MQLDLFCLGTTIYFVFSSNFMDGIIQLSSVALAHNVHLLQDASKQQENVKIYHYSSYWYKRVKQ